MRLALIGNGGMGSLVAFRARANGHDVSITISSGNAGQSSKELASTLHNHDAAIDFSVPSAVLKNVEACALARVPLVEGTTGWNDQRDEARRIITLHNGAMVFGANFSIGVNIFYRIVAHAAALIQAAEGYEPFIHEAHHSRKLDAPSGTALQLRDILNRQMSNRQVSVASTRAGHIPGTHSVGFDSAGDQITLTHMARSREGFAAGALAAAKWIQKRNGFYEFSEMIDDIIRE